jgi:hypothetical protein
MEFSVNHPIIFVMVGVIIAAVLAQSIFFLVRAMRRAKELGMESKTLRKTIKTAAIFTIAPAIAIVISVMTLAKDLGLALPWLRLSVIGSLSYETVAAANAVSAMGLTLGQVKSLTASQYITITWVMTLSILVGIWLMPLIGKRIQNGMVNIGNKDKKWSEIFTNAMFIGMLSAFLGFVFSDFSTVFSGDWSGLIPVLVMIVSALVMGICGLLVKKIKWIYDYALPLSMILGMLSAIPITNWLS